MPGNLGFGFEVFGQFGFLIVSYYQFSKEGLAMKWTKERKMKMLATRMANRAAKRAREQAFVEGNPWPDSDRDSDPRHHTLSDMERMVLRHAALIIGRITHE